MAKLPMYVKRQGKGFQAQPPGVPSRFFSDARAGKAEALHQAAGYARLHADKGKANPTTGRFVRDPAKTEGIFRLVIDREGTKYAYWVATADLEPGKQKQKRFSIGRLGEAGAKAEARKARAAMVKELLGRKSTRRA